MNWTRMGISKTDLLLYSLCNTGKKEKKSLENYARIFLIFAAGSEIQHLNLLTHTDKKKINCHNLAADVSHLKVTAAPKERLGSFFNGCLGQTLHAFQKVRSGDVLLCFSKNISR